MSVVCLVPGFGGTVEDLARPLNCRPDPEAQDRMHFFWRQSLLVAQTVLGQLGIELGKIRF